MAKELALPLVRPEYAILPENVRDISSEVLDERGRIRVLPASYWETTTVAERAMFGHLNGIYSFPTTELVDYLRELIGGRSAIEIGAGNGVLAEALGIPATDNRQQDMARYRAVYKQSGQPTVPYGPNIIRLDAREAVRKYKPEVVIGCWVTHKYNRKRHAAGGNEIGVDEEDVISRCDQYVVIGSEKVHSKKSIWDLPKTVERPNWLYSRSANGTPDIIAIWSREA